MAKTLIFLGNFGGKFFFEVQKVSDCQDCRNGLVFETGVVGGGGAGGKVGGIDRFGGKPLYSVAS